MIGSGSYARQNKVGFTIVELIVIIIVVAILATLTIVSYNIVTQNVREQAVRGDLQKVITALNNFKADNGVYPSVLSQLDFQPGEDMSYQYSYKSTDDSFCITASGIGADLFAKNGSRETTSGGCPGHGVRGVAAITNLMPNPSFETTMDGANRVCGTNATCALTRDTTMGNSGSSSARLQWTTAPTGEPYIILGGAVVQPGDSYVCSASIRTTWATNVQLRTVTHTSTGSWQTQRYGSTMSSPANQWNRTSVVNTSVPAGGATASCLIVVPNGASMPPANASLYMDAVMVTKSTTLYGYADGTSPSWVWNGAPNASTSTGPAL